MLPEGRARVLGGAPDRSGVDGGARPIEEVIS